MVNSKQWVYGALSVLCPVLIVGAVLALQAVAYSSIPSPSDPPNDAHRHAALLMVLAEVGQLLMATTVGCLLGVILAIRTLKLQKRWFGIGLLGLIFNGIPLVFLAALWIRRS